MRISSQPDALFWTYMEKACVVAYTQSVFQRMLSSVYDFHFLGKQAPCRFFNQIQNTPFPSLAKSFWNFEVDCRRRRRLHSVKKRGNEQFGEIAACERSKGIDARGAEEKYSLLSPFPLSPFLGRSVGAIFIKRRENPAWKLVWRANWTMIPLFPGLTKEKPWRNIVFFFNSCLGLCPTECTLCLAGQPARQCRMCTKFQKDTER